MSGLHQNRVAAGPEETIRENTTKQSYMEFTVHSPMTHDNTVTIDNHLLSHKTIHTSYEDKRNGLCPLQ